MLRDTREGDKMSDKKICADCGSERVSPFEYSSTLPMKGQIVTFKAHSFRCSHCGEEFDTAESLDKNLESARKEYSKIMKVTK